MWTAGSIPLVESGGPERAWISLPSCLSRCVWWAISFQEASRRSRLADFHHDVQLREIAQSRGDTASDLISHWTCRNLKTSICNFPDSGGPHQSRWTCIWEVGRLRGDCPGHRVARKRIEDCLRSQTAGFKESQKSESGPSARDLTRTQRKLEIGDVKRNSLLLCKNPSVKWLQRRSAIQNQEQLIYAPPELLQHWVH